MKLVDILSVNPSIKVDLKYATPDNFTGHIVYDFQHCLLLERVAKQLSLAQAEVEQLGLSLKIWDGYRPIAAQWIFWKLVPDERFVGDPRKGGRHTRGTAVDLTLVTQEGHELPMPTPFDEFTERAHSDFSGASVEATQNRELLKTIMKKYGFEGVPTEWWHFDYVGWENFPPIEIDVNAYTETH